MRFTVAAFIAAAATGVLAAPAPQTGVCFDSFDCLLSGGGNCVNFACVKDGTPTSSGTAPSGTSGGTTTGGICFDSFDCLLSGGGTCTNFQCVKTGSGLLG